MKGKNGRARRWRGGKGSAGKKEGKWSALSPARILEKDRLHLRIVKERGEERKEMRMTIPKERTAIPNGGGRPPERGGKRREDLTAPRHGSGKGRKGFVLGRKGCIARREKRALGDLEGPGEVGPLRFAPSEGEEGLPCDRERSYHSYLRPWKKGRATTTSSGKGGPRSRCTEGKERRKSQPFSRSR